jgi:hypothetical protein
MEIPNFMTLGIVLGSSPAAHAGQRILMSRRQPSAARRDLVIIGAYGARRFILSPGPYPRRQVKAQWAEAKQRALDNKSDADAPSQSARDAESQGQSS